MAIPYEDTPRLVDSIMSELPSASWSRIHDVPEAQDAVKAVGPNWQVTVVRWFMNRSPQYEAVATTTAKFQPPMVIRLPPTEAERAWMIYDQALLN